MNWIPVLIDFEAPAYTTGLSTFTSFKIIAHPPEEKRRNTETCKYVSKSLCLPNNCFMSCKGQNEYLTNAN